MGCQCALRGHAPAWGSPGASYPLSPTRLGLDGPGRWQFKSGRADNSNEARRWHAGALSGWAWGRLTRRATGRRRDATASQSAKNRAWASSSPAGGCGQPQGYRRHWQAIRSGQVYRYHDSCRCKWGLKKECDLAIEHQTHESSVTSPSSIPTATTSTVLCRAAHPEARLPHADPTVLGCTRGRTLTRREPAAAGFAPSDLPGSRALEDSE